MNSPTNRRRIVWCTWVPHQRTRALVSYFGHGLLELSTPRKGLRRYIELSARTLRWLRVERPDVLIVQSPSIVLSVFALVLRRYFGYLVVIDAHNEAVQAFNHDSLVARFVYDKVLCSADLVVVTNQYLSTQAQAVGARTVILPDKIPDVPERIAAAPFEGPYVLAICTFSKDEPIEQMMAAASQNSDVQFVFTGRRERFFARKMFLPKNVFLSGYLDDANYWAAVANAAVIIDLSVKPACLVCGAYEAICMGRPILLSNDPAVRHWFGRAASYVDNDPTKIAVAVRNLLSESDLERVERIAARQEIDGRWTELAAIFLARASALLDAR